MLVGKDTKFSANVYLYLIYCCNSVCCIVFFIAIREESVLVVFLIVVECLLKAYCNIAVRFK